MKLLPILLAVIAATMATLQAENLLQISDPGFETLPTSGMVVHKGPGVDDSLKISIDPVNDLSGGNSLKISLPVAAHASVSFSLNSSYSNGSIRFGYRGELAEGADVKFGIQSFTMNGGFKSLDFRILLPSSHIGPQWNINEQPIQRAKGATHWQFAVSIKGPATIWIDELSATGQ